MRTIRETVLVSRLINNRAADKVCRELHKKCTKHLEVLSKVHCYWTALNKLSHCVTSEHSRLNLVTKIELTDGSLYLVLHVMTRLVLGWSGLVEKSQHEKENRYSTTIVTPVTTRNIDEKQKYLPSNYSVRSRGDASNRFLSITAGLIQRLKTILTTLFTHAWIDPANFSWEAVKHGQRWISQ